MLIVKVPKPSPQAANKDRKIGTLLASQVKHMYILEQALAKKHQYGKTPEEITTEAEAAAFIRHVTQKLQEKHKAVRKLVMPHIPQPIVLDRLAAKAESAIENAKRAAEEAELATAKVVEKLVEERKEVVSEAKELLHEGKELVSDAKQLLKKARARASAKVQGK